MPSIKQLLSEKCHLDAVSDSPQLDTELLLAFCLGKDRSFLYTWPDFSVATDIEQHFSRCMAERATGKPIAYLIGEQEFWSLTLFVNEHTLVPRADTERLVEIALELSDDACIKLLDLGTGSGAIALALAKERPQWAVTAIDNSEQALAVARLNAQRQGVVMTFLQSDWFEGITDGCFDIIASNPPYIAEGDPHLQLPNALHEPQGALISEDQGLADLKLIIEQAPTYLNVGGWLLLEHGWKQAESVKESLASRGFQSVRTARDYAGHARVSFGQWQE